MNFAYADKAKAAPCAFCDVQVRSVLVVPMSASAELHVACCPHCYLRPELTYEHILLEAAP